MPRLESDESVEFLGCFDGSAIRLELDTARPFLSLARPGHTDETTIGRERERSPFVRVWSGVDPEGTERVRVGSRDATLIVWSPDYDRKGKASVRFDDGDQAIVGGSRVKR